jgi:hypothetical protein
LGWNTTISIAFDAAGELQKFVSDSLILRKRPQGPRVAPLWGDTGGDLTLPRRRPPLPLLPSPRRHKRQPLGKLVGSPRMVAAGISLLHPRGGEPLDRRRRPHEVRTAATWRRVLAIDAAGREPRLRGRRGGGGRVRGVEVAPLDLWY